MRAWFATGENQGVEAFLYVGELSYHLGEKFLDIQLNIVTLDEMMRPLC